MNKHTIPEKYFIDRWRPIDRKQVKDPTTFIPAELTGSNITLRYNLLGREFVNVAASGCLSLERTNYMMNELRRIHCELREMPVGQQNNDSDRATSEQQRNIANEEIHDIGGQVMDRVTQQTSIMVTTQELTHLGTQMTSIADVNPATVTLRNPDVVPKKGRPKGTQKGRRLMPLGEVVRSKKQITCSNCGSHEHNKATCSLPPNDVPF
jgi:hypothetical protein